MPGAWYLNSRTTLRCFGGARASQAPGQAVRCAVLLRLCPPTADGDLLKRSKVIKEEIRQFWKDEAVQQGLESTVFWQRKGAVALQIRLLSLSKRGTSIRQRRNGLPPAMHEAKGGLQDGAVHTECSVQIGNVCWAGQGSYWVL